MNGVEIDNMNMEVETVNPNHEAVLVFYDEYGPKKVSAVDISRMRLIDQMTPDQRDMFLIGMSYHSAFFTRTHGDAGQSQSTDDIKELKAVQEALDRQGFTCEVNAK